MSDSVPLDEQYRLAERIVDLWSVERDHDSFGALVLECVPQCERECMEVEA